MPNTYYGSIGLRGYDGRISTIQYDLGTFAGADPGQNHEDAQDALNQIRGALVDITAADLAFVRLTERVQEFDTIPTNEDARVHEVAAVVCHLNAAGTVGKYVTLYVPAPVDGVFLGDEGDGETKNIVDVNDADLQQYIQQVAQHARVSDGEQINTSTGAGGIRSGRRITRRIPRPTL
jgi:hypothetical protein